MDGGGGGGGGGLPPPLLGGFGFGPQPLSGTTAGVQLLRDGFVQIDNFLGAERAGALRTEIVAAAASGLLHPHQFEFGGRRFVKPQVFEFDLHRRTSLGQPADPAADGALPRPRRDAAEFPGFSELFDQRCPELIGELNRLEPALQLRPRVDGPDDSVTLKMQHNRGGAATPAASARMAAPLMADC